MTRFNMNGSWSGLRFNEDEMSKENEAAAIGGMRIFVFKSEANKELHAFAADLAGSQLPPQFKPWRATGAIAPDGEFTYKLSREAIEAAIREHGYQLWRVKRSTNDK